MSISERPRAALSLSILVGETPAPLPGVAAPGAAPREHTLGIITVPRSRVATPYLQWPRVEGPSATSYGACHQVAFGAAAGLCIACLCWTSPALAQRPQALAFKPAVQRGVPTEPDGLRSALVDAGTRDGGPEYADARDAGSLDAGRGLVPPTGWPTEAIQAPSRAEHFAGPMLAPLPKIEPDPSVAPVIQGRRADQPAPPALPPGERPRVVVKTILGLLALLVLAYLGGHRRVLQWEERLGVSQLITAGFPFVILGMLARLPGVGILSDAVLTEIGPLLRLGLGWIGFVAGFRFDTRMFHGLPSVAVRIVALSTLLPFSLVVGACAALLFAFSQGPFGFRDPVFLRDAIILGTAGAMTAVTSTRAFSKPESASIASRVIRLEELSGVAGLAFVAAFFRPQSASWQIPGAAWVLLTVGLGATVGLLVYVILQRSAPGADFLVLTLGSVSFAAGAAGYLLLSSVVVAFIAGVLLANFPGAYHARLGDLLLRLERPIYLASLLIVGSLWQVTDWRGWLLMPVFTVLRLMGKWLGTNLALRRNELELSNEERRALALPPLGPLAIAIVVNAQLLYPGGSISLIVSAVIGGGVLTELFLQLANRQRTRSTSRRGSR